MSATELEAYCNALCNRLEQECVRALDRRAKAGTARDTFWNEGVAHGLGLAMQCIHEDWPVGGGGLSADEGGARIETEGGGA